MRPGPHPFDDQATSPLTWRSRHRCSCGGSAGGADERLVAASEGVAAERAVAEGRLALAAAAGRRSLIGGAAEGDLDGALLPTPGDGEGDPVAGRVGADAGDQVGEVLD